MFKTFYRTAFARLRKAARRLPPEPLPPAYAWLASEPGPAMLIEALRCHGVREITGPDHASEIMTWAEEVGGWVSRYYKADETPWCGLFMAAMAKRAGHEISQEVLSARWWRLWGEPVPDKPALGDVLVFSRSGGGHVGLYVGEDERCFHVLGGNQSNAITIARVERNRFIAARKGQKGARAANVRRVFMGAAGPISEGEA